MITLQFPFRNLFSSEAKMPKQGLVTRFLVIFNKKRRDCLVPDTYSSLHCTCHKQDLGDHRLPADFPDFHAGIIEQVVRLPL